MFRKAILTAVTVLSLTAAFAATNTASAWCNDGGYRSSSYSYGYSNDYGHGYRR